jgi:hypothetical protein
MRYNQKIPMNFRGWIASLGPYATLALFSVPFIILEPAKPAAAYLAVKGHTFTALGLFVLSELLKLLVVERLFAASREKLMSFRVLAWAYRRYRKIKHRLTMTLRRTTR